MQAFGPVQAPSAPCAAVRISQEQRGAKSSSTCDASHAQDDVTERRKLLETHHPVTNSCAATPHLRPRSPLALSVHPSSPQPRCVRDGDPDAAASHGAGLQTHHSSAADTDKPASQDDVNSPDVEPASYFARLSARLSQKASQITAASETAGPASAPRTGDAQGEHQPATTEARGASSSYEQLCAAAMADGTRCSSSAVSPTAAAAPGNAESSPSAGDDDCVSQEPRTTSNSFEYDLPQQELDGDGMQDDEGAFDQGSQLHCYGNVAIEETPRDVSDEEDRIESSHPEEDLHPKEDFQHEPSTTSKASTAVRPLSSEDADLHAQSRPQLQRVSSSSNQPTSTCAPGSHHGKVSSVGCDSEHTHSLRTAGAVHASQQSVGVASTTLEHKARRHVSKSFDYHLPESTPHADAGAFVGFKTGKGRVLETKPENSKRAHALLGELVGDMQATAFTSTALPCAKTAVSEDRDNFPLPPLDLAAPQGPAGQAPKPARSDQSVDANNAETDAAQDLTVHEGAFENDRASILRSSKLPRDAEVPSGKEASGKIADAEHGHQDLKSARYSAEGNGTRHRQQKFSYDLSDDPSPAKGEPAGAGYNAAFASFKTGSGKSLALKPESVTKATSIFGTLLGDLQALQAKDGDGCPTPAATTQFAVQGNSGPVFSKGTGKIVEPSHSVIKSVRFSEGGTHASGLSAREEAEPVFSTGLGNVVNPSEDSMRKAQVSYGGSSRSCSADGQSAALGGSSQTKARSMSSSFTAPRPNVIGERSAAQKISACTPFESGGEPLCKTSVVVGFKSGTGRSLGSNTNMSSVTSIFGSLLSDMQALQSEQQHQHTQDESMSEAPQVRHSQLSHSTDSSIHAGPMFSSGSGRVMQQGSMAKQFAADMSDSCRYFEPSAGPVFSKGGGRVVEPSQGRMQICGDNTPQSACVLQDAEPVFRKGTGTSIQPSQESMLKVRGADKDAAGGALETEDSGPVFSKGTGKVVQPSETSLMAAMSRYGSGTFANGSQGATNSSVAASHAMANERMDSPASAHRPLVPKFGNQADPAAIDAMSLVSRSLSAGKRPATSNNDRRPFKMPRRFVAPVPTTPSSSSPAHLHQGNGTPFSAIRNALPRDAFGHDSPHTPGLLSSSSHSQSKNSSGKALATPCHLFSPNTAMKITGFRVFDAALMDSCQNSSVDSSIANASGNVSFNGNTSAMSADESVGPDFLQRRLNETSLTLPLQEAVQHSLPFEDWTNGNIEIKEYMKIRQIGPQNAAQFKFTCGSTHFFRMPEGEGEATGTAAEQDIGLEQMHAVLQTHFQGSNGDCPDQEWAENHYKWIVWKLASMERAFPSIFGGRWLTPDRVMVQLFNRYDREVQGSSRSVLMQIKQRDQKGSQHLVLCVATIDMQGEKVVLELMDGWHSMRASASPAIAQLTRQGKIFVGQKLRLYGSDTVHEEGKDAVLKIGSNGARRAEWHAKLGVQAAWPFFVGIRSIKPGEGVVPAVMIVVQRVFPVVHMESLPSGEKKWRSTESEEAARAAAQKAQQDAWENYVTAQMKLENIQGEAETRDAALERQEKMEEWRQDFVKSQAERKVSSVMRIRVACLHPVQQHQQQAAAEAYISFWRPQESTHEDVKEGAVLELHNLSIPSVTKNGRACLSSMPGTKCRRLRKLSTECSELANATYRARAYVDVSALHRMPIPMKQEVDVIGVAVAISDAYAVETHKGRRLKQAIVLTCRSDASEDEEQEHYAVVRLDLTGLSAVKFPAGRTGKDPGARLQAAVLAAKNLNDFTPVKLRGEDACCSVMVGEAFEDAQILYSTPGGGGGSAVPAGDGPSQAEHWQRLADWIKQDSGLAEAQRILPRRALRARRILQALGQGGQQQ